VTSRSVGGAADDQQQGQDQSGGGFSFLPCHEEPTPELRQQGQQDPHQGPKQSVQSMGESEFDDIMPLWSGMPLGGGAVSSSKIDEDTCSLYQQLIRSKGVQCR